VSHPDSLARRPIDPTIGNSFGSYSEPCTRNSCQAEISPMVRDDEDVTPELRWRRGEGVGRILLVCGSGMSESRAHIEYLIQTHNIIVLDSYFI